MPSPLDQGLRKRLQQLTQKSQKLTQSAWLKSTLLSTKRRIQAQAEFLGQKSQKARTSLNPKLNQIKQQSTLFKNQLLNRNARAELIQRMKAALQPQVILGRIKKLIDETDPQAVLAWIYKLAQKKKNYFYGALTTLVLCTYFLADITALIVDELIPEPPAYIHPRATPPKPKSIQYYSAIFERNLFNSQGLIPGEDESSEGPNLNSAPVRTALPFTLIGTLIMEDPDRSVATIEDKTASSVYPVQTNDEIPGKAKILEVLASRVIFINKTNGKKEYVELPQDPNSTNPRISLGSGMSSSSPGIEKLTPTQYNVSRTEVDKALADFNNILTQARAVPNFENGVAAGYKLFQIVPGSIYDKLGLQNGDVITGLNGSPINDPGKAFQMLEELKTSSHLELQIKKEGRQASTYSYDIH